MRDYTLAMQIGRNWVCTWTLFLLMLVAGVDSGAQAPQAYDVSKTVALSGLVVIVTFGSPHCYVLIDVKDAAGRSTRWVAEGANLQRVTAAGLNKSVITPGMTVQVHGHPKKKDASVGVVSDVPKPISDAIRAGQIVSATELTLPSGRRIAFGG